jgi:DNA-3-methyladenine glycosylase II
LNPADAHLLKDPVMAGLIEGFGGPFVADSIELPREVYGSLLRGITGQQLSVRSAEAIYGRMLERFGGRPPTPAELLADDPEAMRVAAGLSHAKVVALRSLAEHMLAGELQLSELTELPDDEVTRQLVAVKGIGEWTAQMFLMFTLHRPDVLPTGDQGIKNAVMRAYGLEVVPKPDALTLIAEPWRPYRTRACEYLWRSLENAPLT